MEETNQVYIKILADSLVKKLEVLGRLEELTSWQEKILSMDTFNEDDFDQSMKEKEEQLAILDELDRGFENLYSRVKEELAQNKGLYKKDIISIQHSIEEITNCSVKLQAMEARNRERFRVCLAAKHKEIRDVRMNSQSAASYYKNMSNQHQAGQSYFMDKKK